MENNSKKRRSHCIHCGKRLSSITAAGKIQWQPSQVDDTGLFCISCYEAHEAPKSKKRTKPSK